MSVYSFGETTTLADCPSTARLQPQPSVAGEKHSAVLPFPTALPGLIVSSFIILMVYCLSAPGGEGPLSGSRIRASFTHTCAASFAKSTLLQKLEMRTWGLEAGHLEGVSFERVSSGSLWLGLLICRGSCEHLPHRVVARMK